MTKEPLKLSGLWIRRINKTNEILLEIDGKWLKVKPLSGDFNGDWPCSEIIEPSGILEYSTEEKFEVKK